MSMRTMGRRDFLRLSTTVAVGGVLAACAQPGAPTTEPVGEPAAPPAAPAAPAAPAGELRFTDPPLLAARISSGELPTVEERLPLDPQIVTPLERVGEYGGTLNVTTIRAEGYGDDTILMGCEGLFRTDTDGSSVAPNIAKAWEFSEDGKVFTIHFREGLKWSDGEPVTADDFMFAWEAVYLNTTIPLARQVVEARRRDDQVRKGRRLYDQGHLGRAQPGAPGLGRRPHPRRQRRAAQARPHAMACRLRRRGGAHQEGPG